MNPKKHPTSGLSYMNCQGFILLEVLVAMSMILGVWMSSVGIYQRLALNLVQQEAKRSQLGKDLDAFEAQEHSRAHFNIPSKSLSHESARVSSRNRAVHTSTQSTIKDKR
jgi:type II secretory pathway pseudopilin PulG